jgi:TgpA N-terminal domain/Transglutaminase-like superfamily
MMSQIRLFGILLGLVCFLCTIAGLSFQQSIPVILILGVLIWVFVMNFYVQHMPQPKPIVFLDPNDRRTRAPMSGLADPVIMPISEERLPKKLASPIPERLPTVNLPPPPVVPIDLAPETLPNFSVPPSPIEESLLFRVLVQVLFTIGVISADLAVGTHYARVAIPITTAGAVWSWHRRQSSWHWLNMGVLVAVVAILFVGIFPIIISEIKPIVDNAELAVQQKVMLVLVVETLAVAIQMGLSFHLYGRNVLGYGIVISTLLMAIAAYLSHSISFLILLCGFVAIAIPTLMLDYRSRIALKPIGISAIPTRELLPYKHLPWKYLGRLAAISVGIGLMVAVMLPNFRLPNLSLQNPRLDRWQNLTQQAQNNLPSTPPPFNNTGSTNSDAAVLQLSVGDMASQLLGQPGNNNYPDSIKQEQLQLPPEISGRLQQFTQKILATSQQPLGSDYARSAYLAEYLKQHHQADPQQIDPNNLPPINAKSIERIVAKCPPTRTDCPIVANSQDLPVLYTSMLRSIGIPARLKTGEKPLEIDPKTQMYPRPPAGDPSKTEVYFPNWGWFGLDSTPDRPLLNPDARQIAQLQQQVKTLPLTSPDLATTPTPPDSAPKPNLPSPNPSVTSGSNSPFSKFKPNHVPSIEPSRSLPQSELPKWEPNPAILKLIVIVIVIAIAIAGYLAHQHRHKQQQQLLASLPPVERIYRSMLTSLSGKGLYKLPSQTQLEYANNTRKISHPQIAKVVWEISSAYIAWRYGKQKPNIRELEKKLHFLQHLQQLAAARERQQKMAKFKSQFGFK